jgi:hypothetical protein
VVTISGSNFRAKQQFVKARRWVSHAVCSVSQGRACIFIKDVCSWDEYLPATGWSALKRILGDKLPMASTSLGMMQDNRHRQGIIYPVLDVALVWPVPPALAIRLTKPAQATLDLESQEPTADLLALHDLNMGINSVIMILLTEHPSKLTLNSKPDDSDANVRNLVRQRTAHPAIISAGPPHRWSYLEIFIREPILQEPPSTDGILAVHRDLLPDQQPIWQQDSPI